MTVDDLLARIGRVMTESWLEEIAWTRETLAGFLANGCPTEYAKVLRDLFGIPLETWPKLIHPPKALPRHEPERIIRSMDVNTQGRSANVKRGAGRATRKHPAQKKLYEKGKTITDVAAELGEGRPRVSAWFADGEANRPIPKRHAEKLRDKYGIPMNAWSRVAD